MFDLENIKDPSFIKKLTIKELKILASEIRTFFETIYTSSVQAAAPFE